MKNVFDLVLNKIEEFNTPCCIGLDPHISSIPQKIKQESLATFGNTRKAVANAIFQFNKLVVDATEDIVGISRTSQSPS